MKLLRFPNLRQTYEFDCGPQVMQSILGYYGLNVKESEIMKVAGTTRGGTNISGLQKVARKYGLKTRRKKMTIRQVKNYIDKKIPVVLFVQAWPDKDKRFKGWENAWQYDHCVVAIGYDKDKMYFEDPEVFNLAFLTYEELKKRWHDIEHDRRYQNYGLAVFGKKPKFNPKKIVHMG